MKKISLLLFVLLLSGCSAKFAYNNVNWLIYWYLDDYVEFNTEQERMFEGMLSNWMAWHKEQELPRYQSHLNDIAVDIKTGNITEQTIAQHRQRAKEHWVRVRGHIAPDLVTLGATLSQDQIVYLFAGLEKENVEDEEEIQENLALDPSLRVEKWIERNKKGLKKWLGRTTNQQEAFIADFHPRFESTRSHWLAYKRAYQNELRKAFMMEQNSEAFQLRLLALINDPDQFRSQSFQNAMASNTATSAQYAMGLLSMASDKQINRLLGEINDLRKDLAELQVK